MTSSPDLSSATDWSLPDLARAPGARAPSRPSPEALTAEREAAAYARGMEDGQRQMEQSLGSQLAAAGAALEHAAAALLASTESQRAAAEDNIAALALVAARHLVLREIAADPAVLAELVRRAAALLPLEQRLEVRLHPGDLATLEAHDGLPAPRPGVDVQWIADTAVEPGGCLVSSPRRLVDGRIDEALVNLYDRLRHS